MLTTLETVKMYLDIKDTDTDNLLEFLIDATSTRIESECNRKFGKAVYSEKHICNGRAILKLNNYPVLAISEVKIDGIVITDYVVELESGIMYIKDNGTTINITYTAGYVLPDDAFNARTFPTDLEMACIQLISIAMNTRDTEGLLVEVVGPLRSQFATDIPDYIQRILNRYKNPVIA